MSKYTDVDWTTEQVQFALDSILSKITDGDSDITIKPDSWNKTQFTVENRLLDQGRVYVSIRKDWIFMILDNKVSGHYKPKYYFWQDRPLKRTMKRILYLLSNQERLELERRAQELKRYKASLAQDALMNSFPEAISKAFEKTVLGVNNGKEDKENGK